MTDASGTNHDGTRKEKGLGSHGTIPNEPGSVGVGAGEPTTFEPEEDPEAAAHRDPHAHDSGDVGGGMSDTNETPLFDTNDPAHQKALGKLDRDIIAWFTTVSQSGEPHSVPVWFLWRHGTLLVMSEPDAAKVKHVRRGSPVLVHLEGGEFGNDVVVLNGTAEISERTAAEWLPEIADVYTEKYRAAIEDYGEGIDAIMEKYSTVIVVTPTKLMAW